MSAQKTPGDLHDGSAGYILFIISLEPWKKDKLLIVVNGVYSDYYS